MLLLLDIGNTHTHLGLANSRRVVSQTDLPTAAWFTGALAAPIRQFVGRARLKGAALCSVVPRATPLARQTVRRLWHLPCLQLTPATLRGLTPGAPNSVSARRKGVSSRRNGVRRFTQGVGLGIDYPHPETIGPDRLANALAARHRFGAPVVVVDFGTAVTFDVVDRAGNYVGGIIAPGLAAMTDYLHEKTALLPRIKIREIQGPIGKTTEQAMLVGAVHGYRGLICELILELKRELNTRRLPVVATGGYSRLIASKLPEITAVDPLLTLEGLRLLWQAA